MPFSCNIECAWPMSFITASQDPSAGMHMISISFLGPICLITNHKPSHTDRGARRMHRVRQIAPLHQPLHICHFLRYGCRRRSYLRANGHLARRVRRKKGVGGCTGIRQKSATQAEGVGRWERRSSTEAMASED